MSYRIELINRNNEELQVFGNNECPKIFLDEIKKQGAIIDEEDNFDKFKIKDIMPIITCIDTYVKELEIKFQEEKQYHDIEIDVENELYNLKKVYQNSIFDFTNDIYLRDNAYPLWLQAEYKINCAYLFFSYNFIKHIEDSLDRVSLYEYKLKDGEEIFLKGN